MPPIRLTCKVGGKERGSVTAEDGVTRTLETPAGTAFARSFQEEYFERVVVARSITTNFPGESRKTEWNFGRGHPRRVRVYQTEKGKVQIKAEFIDKE